MKLALTILTGMALIVFAGSAAMAKPGCGIAEAGESIAAPETVAQEEVAAKAPVNVGNKICPVSGQEVGTMGDVITVEYEGKVYNLCCAGCIAAFNNDPAKYIAIINAELEASP